MLAKITIIYSLFFQNKFFLYKSMLAFKIWFIKDIIPLSLQTIYNGIKTSLCLNIINIESVNVEYRYYFLEG